jgi:hypothetical protein
LSIFQKGSDWVEVVFPRQLSSALYSKFSDPMAKVALHTARLMGRYALNSKQH